MKRNIKQARGSRTSEDGRVSLGFLLLFLIVLALVPAGCAAFKLMDRSAPAIHLKSDAKAIGRSSRITIEADEPRYGVRDLRASFVQGSLEIPLGELTNPGTPWWRFWRRERTPSALLEVEVGRERIPEMKEGPAVIRATATNDSWARFGKGRTSVKDLALPVVLTPPRVEVLSAQHYIRQGGSECVLYRVSDSAVSSGVRAGDYFFNGYPLPNGAPQERFAIFAFPHDLPVTTVPLIVARDAADNEATATFSYKVFPQSFRDQNLQVSDDFLRRVVPAILSRSPSLQSQGDLLKDFLEINGRLRRINGAYLVEMAGESSPERLWKGSFLQLGGSQVEASFADHRRYVYEGRVVDEQDHLGFDLAVTASHPIDAANDGVVALASYFGIYGNTVVIDHGCGLMTLYAHLSSIDVRPGQKVAKGEVLGRSGATGLAGGDHLHFSVLVQGIPVNPVEWWDAHWIRDRIETKIGPTTTPVAARAANPSPSGARPAR